MTPLYAMFLTKTLVHLSLVDYVIVAFYFVLVLAIGWYLKGRANTGEDFFMAGREMTAWVAGLSFLSANLGALELMGWAGSAYQYGILATHWYWIGAIPAMLFLALVMMPFYYISKTHSVPGYLKLRFGEPARAVSAVSFALMTVLMSGVNMFAMAKVMQIVLGWDINFSIWVSSLTVAIYVTLGGLRSAIFNEVLQFFLIWAGALLIPILGLYEAGGWANLKIQIAQRASEQYVHLWSGLGHFGTNPMGIHWTGIVFGLGSVISMGYWTTDFLVVQRILAAKDIRSAEMAPIIGAGFKMMVPFQPQGQRSPLREHGSLDHHHRSAHQHWYRVPGDGICQHHGLRASSIQLLCRPALRNGSSGNALEAGDGPWRVLGPVVRDALINRYVGVGEG